MVVKRKPFTSSEDCSKEKESKEKIDILRMLKGIEKKILKWKAEDEIDLKNCSIKNNKPQKVIE